VRLALLIIPLVALRAEDLPDAAALLERSTHALDAYRSYQFDYSLVVQNSRASGEAIPPTVVSAPIAGMNPGKVHIELKSPGLRQMIIYDGQTTTTYESGQNTYIRESGLTGWAKTLTHVGGVGTLENSEISRSTVREETIDVDGEPHECWVVERTMSAPWPTPGLPSRRAELQETTWIDKKLWIDWQVLSINKPEGGNRSQTTARKTMLKLDPDLPDSTFTFTPPAGARERFTGVH
jgi:outer membrane lipoprotein-sorting protein